MKKSQKWLKILVCLIALFVLVGCNSGENAEQAPQSEQPAAETYATAPEQSTQSDTTQTADTVPQATSFGYVRYQLNGGDMVCGTGRVVQEGLPSFTVVDGQVFSSTQPAMGLTTTGSSVFAKGSLYDLANRYCQVNSSISLFVRASELGSALE